MKFHCFKTCTVLMLLAWPQRKLQTQIAHQKQADDQNLLWPPVNTIFIT